MFSEANIYVLKETTKSQIRLVSEDITLVDSIRKTFTSPKIFGLHCLAAGFRHKVCDSGTASFKIVGYIQID